MVNLKEFIKQRMKENKLFIEQIANRYQIGGLYPPGIEQRIVIIIRALARKIVKNPENKITENDIKFGSVDIDTKNPQNTIKELDDAYKFVEQLYSTSENENLWKILTASGDEIKYDRDPIFKSEETPKDDDKIEFLGRIKEEVLQIIVNQIWNIVKSLVDAFREQLEILPGFTPPSEPPILKSITQTKGSQQQTTEIKAKKEVAVKIAAIDVRNSISYIREFLKSLGILSGGAKGEKKNELPILELLNKADKLAIGATLEKLVKSKFPDDSKLKEQVDTIKENEKNVLTALQVLDLISRSDKEDLKKLDILKKDDSGEVNNLPNLIRPNEVDEIIEKLNEKITTNAKKLNEEREKTFDAIKKILLL